MSSLGKRSRSTSVRNPAYMTSLIVRQQGRRPLVRTKRSKVLQKSKALAPEIKQHSGSFIETPLLMTNVSNATATPWKLIDCVYNNRADQIIQRQQVLNGLEHSTRSYGRLGRKTKLKSLTLRMEFLSRWQRDVKVRYVLVCKKDFDKKAVDNLLSDDNNPYSQISNTPVPDAVGTALPSIPSGQNVQNGIRALRNLETTGNLRILLDKTVTLKQGWNTSIYQIPDIRFQPDVIPVPDTYGAENYGGVVAGIPWSRVYKNHQINLSGMETVYDAETDNVLKNAFELVDTNGLYLIACADNVSNNTNPSAVQEDGKYESVLVRGNFRLSFYD